ncbi:hypothetical protein [Streptomyces sp. NPDC101206]|uniref:hypothetical protein n=1 Tax=Streptomyces sp. NPDC101206 TaxID=3366128 RepID=UPI0037FDF074
MLEEENVSELSDEQISRIALKLDLTYVEQAEGLLVFDSTRQAGVQRGGEVAIPTGCAMEILEALDRGADRMEGYEGWVDPQNGFAEFEVQSQGLAELRRTERFTFETRPCSHTHDATPPYESAEGMMHPIVRVTSPDGNTCIELSRNTPLCVPRLPVDLKEGRGRTQTTLKIFIGETLERGELERKALGLANSMLFEFDARHRAAYVIRQKWQDIDSRPRRPAISYSVRYPRTSVPVDVAALFSIPSAFTLRRYRTLAFLSYYQILEFYLPAAHRRDALRKVRRVLRSLEFDTEKDSSVLKIVNSVERSQGASEGDQLRTLIEECVPEEKLREFFEEGHGGHFGKRGPISGVAAIHLNSGESVASQVAKRVYALRNRIVHAKDDARYADASVLLPGSREAGQLGPDIELMRLLAIEAIVDNR